MSEKIINYIGGVILPNKKMEVTITIKTEDPYNTVFYDSGYIDSTEFTKKDYVLIKVFTETKPINSDEI